MWYVILSVLLAVCALGWLTQRIISMALLWYLQEKKLPFSNQRGNERGQHVCGRAYD